MSISGDCGEHETAGTLCLDHGADSTRATVTAGQNDWRLRTCGKNSSVVSTMRQQRSKTFAVTLVLIGLIGFSVGLATNQGRTRDQEHSFSSLIEEDSEEQRLLSVVKRAPQSSRFDVKSPFSLSEIVGGSYSSSRWNGTWVSDTEYVYRTDNFGGVDLLSVVSGESRTLIPFTEMDQVFRYWLSPDLSHALLAIRPQKLFRHSFIAVYDIYEVRTGRRTHLEPPQSLIGGPPPGAAAPPQLPLLYATWSPVGNAIAYVFANDIFYRASPTAPDVRITNTGEPGTVFNGIADWVYEEEVLSESRALWFSPDGKNLAWVEFNDTSVDVMPLQIYGRPGALEFQYPIPTPLRYPKPGRTNPFVNVYAVSVARSSSRSPTPILLEPPRYYDDKEKLIYSVTWATNSEVSLTWENRHQNYSVVSICDVTLARCRDSLVMVQSSGWLNLDEPPIFTKDGRRFAMALSADGYQQVNIIDRDTNQRVPVTSNKAVVTSVLHWDEADHVIYYIATRVGAPGERHLYTVTDFDAKRAGVVTCLSCDVTNTRGGSCGYNKFDFSKRKSYYTLSCLGPHVPQEYLFKAPNTKIATLVTNADLSSALASKHLPKISNLDVEIAGGRYVAKVRLYLPHDFDENKRYPLLVNVYAGPNSQQVNDRFRLDWGTYLTTNEQVIYAVIDGRGSGYRGNDLLFEIYYKLGQPEVQDQIDVTKRLLSLYQFIDKDNVAIWGWSYGGFVTTSVLAADAEQDNLFKCGMAVAPVTNWIYYDTIYTERYMGLPSPDDNLEGYRKSDVTTKAKKLKGKKLLLVHGTADDNVHYQQTMMLTRALEEENVLFQQLSYPDENHGIAQLRPHFYRSLTNFILNTCFGRNEAVKK